MSIVYKIYVTVKVIKDTLIIVSLKEPNGFCAQIVVQNL